MCFWRKAGVLLLLSGTVAAQEKLPRYRAIVYGEPYTAKTVTTTYQKLADGTQIEHREVRFQARSSQGWEWYKVNVENKDPLRRSGKDWYAVIVWDPVRHMRIDWCTCNHMAWEKQYGDPPKETPQGEVGSEGRDVLLGPYTDRLKFHLEKIDPQVMHGLETEGTKATRVVKAGMDGNDRDLVTTIQSWYSSKLHIPMYTITDDWKTGLRKFEVVDLSLAEPDPAIFHVPEGYSVRPSEPSPR